MSVLGLSINVAAGLASVGFMDCVTVSEPVLLRCMCRDRLRRSAGSIAGILIFRVKYHRYRRRSTRAGRPGRDQPVTRHRCEGHQSTRERGRSRTEPAGGSRRSRAEPGHREPEWRVQPVWDAGGPGAGRSVPSDMTTNRRFFPCAHDSPSTYTFVETGSAVVGDPGMFDSDARPLRLSLFRVLDDPLPGSRRDPTPRPRAGGAERPL